MNLRRIQSIRQLIKNNYSISIRSFANILITHNVDPISKSILTNRGHKVNHLKDVITEKELINVINDYDCIIVNKMHINSNILHHSENLKIIGKAGVVFYQNSN